MIAVIVLVLCAVPAWADTIWTRSGDAKPFERTNLRILKIENGELVFRVTSSDRQDAKKLEEVWQIRFDSDRVFSTAEEAFAAGNFAKAAENYQRALDSSRVDWVKHRSTMRLVDAAARAGDFPLMARGYAELVKRDPATAARHKPEIPATAKGKSLEHAAAVVDRVIQQGDLSNEQLTVLRAFQLALANASGNTALAQRIARTIGAAEAERPGDTRSRAETRIQVATTALSAKNFDRALKEINEGQDLFTEPEQQVRALYCRAEAKAGLAKDADALRDAALDYMRAVAKARSARVKTPEVPEALLKTAGILERTGVPNEALLLYQQVADEYKGTDAGRLAADGIARLGGAAGRGERQS